jgi:hypothetical protein
MRSEDIRRAQKAQPFVPFTLHLADGREFTIRHPEFMFVSHNERTVIVDDIDGGLEILDPVMVTSISIPPAPVASHSG